MKRLSWKWLLIMGCLLSLQVLARGRVQIDFTGQPYLDEKLRLQVEIEVGRTGYLPLREVRIHYRNYGENNFRSQVMLPEGLRYLASVDLSDQTGQMVEYFLSVEYADGAFQFYPEDGPESELMQIAVNQDFDSGDGIVVITPEPGEIIYADEFLLTASFFGLSSQIDHERTKVFLDSYDVSRSEFLQKFDDFISFAPRRIPPGSHTLRVELYSFSGRLLTQKEWQFSATPRKGPAPKTSNFDVSGNFFAETRNENLVDGTQKREYNKTGLRIEAGTEQYTFGGRIYLSNQEDSRLQPVNRYSGFAQTNFWNERFLRLNAGDTYPQLNQFLLNNIFIRGFHGQLYLKFINFDFTTGQTVRGIEGDSVAVTTIVPGTFEREVTGMRLSFGTRKSFQFGITTTKGKDDPNSIKYGNKPEETAAGGLDVFLATPNRKFIVEGSFNASSYNPNILDGESISYDTLQALGTDIDRKLYDFVTGFITVNENLVVLPSFAYHGTVRLNVANNNLAVTYKRVDSQFRSLGQPFLLRDTKGISITDNIRMFQNQLFLNLRYQDYENNLGNVKPATTDNRTMSFNVSYFPLQNFPSLTFGYSNYKRNNGLDASSSLALAEDNSTNTIQFSTSYGFLFTGLRHNFTLNVLNYNRTDETASGLDNLSNTFSFLLQTRYAIPLKSRLEFNFQQNENTAANVNSSELSLNSFGGGLEYTFNGVFDPQGDLVLALNGRYGLVNTDISTLDPTDPTGASFINNNFDYNRSFVNARIIFSLPDFGRLSLNGDWISYSGDRDFRDYLLTARYDINL
ncbi:MAG: hypothetical protein R3C41_13855 [Calditrichia bacterium]